MAFPMRTLLSLALAGFGTALALLLNTPLPFLFGPMGACLVAALLGARLQAPPAMQNLSRTVLGVAVGASITPAVIAQIPGMWATISLMPLYILVIGVIGVPLFRRMGFDWTTAYFGAMPGGLQDMVLFGQDAGGDARALSLIHATRVALIVTIAPMVLQTLYGVSLHGTVGEPARDLPLRELGLMLAAALVGWQLAKRVGLFGAPLLGPMIVAAGLSLGGLIHHRPPAEAILAAQFFIGIGIGEKYVGVTLRELRRFVASAVVFVLILAVITAIFTEIVTVAGLGRPVDLFLAMAPGGQAEMAVLALGAGADVGFVVLHHLVRIVIVILGAPFVARMTRRAKGP